MGVNEHEPSAKKRLDSKVASPLRGTWSGGKSRMFDELCQDYEYERKYAINLLGDWLRDALNPRLR